MPRPQLLPTVSWTEATATVGEDAGTYTATAKLSSKSDTPITVPWAAVAHTASTGSDFVAASGNLVFGAGEDTLTVCRAARTCSTVHMHVRMCVCVCVLGSGAHRLLASKQQPA